MIAPSHSGDKIKDFGDVILQQSAKRTKVYDDLTAWDGWQVLTAGYAPNLTSGGGNTEYFDFVVHQDQYYCKFTFDAPDVDDVAQVGLLTPTRLTDTEFVQEAELYTYPTGAQTISDNTGETVQFPTNPKDPRNEFDRGCQFTAATKGDYRVKVTIRWEQSMSDETFLKLAMSQEGNKKARNIRYGFAANDPTMQLDKTLYDVEKGDTITISMLHDYGSSRDIEVGQNIT